MALFIGDIYVIWRMAILSHYLNRVAIVQILTPAKFKEFTIMKR